MKYFTKEKGIEIRDSIKNSTIYKVWHNMSLIIGTYVILIFVIALGKEAMNLNLQLVKVTETVTITNNKASSALPITSKKSPEKTIEVNDEVSEVPFKNLDKVEVTREEMMSDYQLAIWLLKSCESLRPESYWDVNQWTSGWGTKSKKGEVISLKESDKRAAKEFNRVYKSLNKRFPKLDRWTKLVLTVTDYNVGHFGEQLNEAIKTGDKEKIAKVLKLYIHDANGKRLEGLVTRRNKEAALLLASDAEKQKMGKLIKAKILRQIKKNKIN